MLSFLLGDLTRDYNTGVNFIFKRYCYQLALKIDVMKIIEAVNLFF